MGTQLFGPERLADLDMSVHTIDVALRTADAATHACSPLDPPIMEGLTRWGLTTRYLREELVAAGWSFDNPRNLARTIHPSGDFAVVVTTGDESTGLPDRTPGPKHPKGYATELAVLGNGQLALELGPLPPTVRQAGPSTPPRPGPGSCCSMRTWTAFAPRSRCPSASPRGGSPSGPNASCCHPSRELRAQRWPTWSEWSGRPSSGPTASRNSPPGLPPRGRPDGPSPAGTVQPVNPRPRRLRVRRAPARSARRPDRRRRA